MKRLVLFFLFGAVCCTAVFSQTAGSTMYVAVKSADVKSSTGIFASKVAVVNMGEAVTVSRTNGKWVEVRVRNLTGWVALASLSSRRITGTSSASAGEIALAGKGFSPETEIEYQKDGLDYSEVNRMETIIVSDADLLKFVEDGRLAKGE
jgi:uncharacterized protein YgiM (DUF1202 family)